MSQQTAGMLMMLATFLMIAAPIALPLVAYWNCRRLKIDATDEVVGALVAGIAVAALCFWVVKRFAAELA